MKYMYDPEAYKMNFYMVHEREPQWIPSGDIYTDDDGNIRHKWTRNVKPKKEENKND
jgi:hypothetical protein